jgi:hypothetical protein
LACLLEFRIDSLAECAAPDFTGSQRRMSYPQFLKAGAARMRVIPNASTHVSSTVQREEVPAIGVDGDPMATIAGKLTALNCPVLKIDASSELLHPPHEFVMPGGFALDILEIGGNAGVRGCHQY